MENGLGEVLGSKGLLKKHEFIRVLVQCLYSLGFKKSASCLEHESKILYKTADYKFLEMQVLSGDWDSCIPVLDRIFDNSKYDMRNTALYLVFKQCLFEYLKRGDVSLALNVLRKQAPMSKMGKEKVHRLAYDIVCSKEMEFGEEDSCLVHDSRNKLIPLPIVIPERRLEHLVETAVMDQIDTCLYDRPFRVYFRKQRPGTMYETELAKETQGDKKGKGATLANKKVVAVRERDSRQLEAEERVAPRV